MRRKIDLYIAGTRADLNDQALVLFNYAQTDLTSPAVVKNSYSQKVTLPGTPANHSIFGAASQPDRRTLLDGNDSGPSFNAGHKTPFTIYDEKGRIVESGYLRLDGVQRSGDIVTGYEVSLFGGIGSLFYGLSYTEDGQKMTLADLDYLGTADPESELDFQINAAAVSAAWAKLGDTAVSDKWHVLNFAPAYEGVPEGDFEPRKGIATVSKVAGLTSSSGSFSTLSGYALVNMPAARDGWACKDLRSYLQRPVVSLRSILLGIQHKASELGYNFVYSDVPAVVKKAWKTLPLLSSIKSFRQDTGSYTATLSSSSTLNNVIGRFNIAQEVPIGTTVKAHLEATLNLSFAGSPSPSPAPDATQTSGSNFQAQNTLFFVQAIAYDLANNAIGGSPVKVYAGHATRHGAWPVSSLVSLAGYTPQVDGTGYETELADYPALTGSGGSYHMTAPMAFDVEAVSPAYYTIRVDGYYFGEAGGEDPFGGLHYNSTGQATAVTGAALRFFTGYNSPVNATGAWLNSGAASITYKTSSSLRTDAFISKRQVLTSSHTPAEYLLSIAKHFGLVFVFDKDTQMVSLVTRNTFYGTGEDTIDLAERIDRGQQITITPQVFTSKWLSLALGPVGGEFMDQYKNIYGRQYGAQRIDTNYEFDAEEVNIMAADVFRGAASILDNSIYWNRIVTAGAKMYPSILLDKGCTETLWDSSGATTSIALSIPPSTATVYYYNSDNHGYDVAGSPRAEFRSGDGKALDGDDVLLYYTGVKSLAAFKLSDDFAIMGTATGGKPCWDLDPGTGSLSVPSFSSFLLNADGDEVTASLEFGTPAELGIPGTDISEGTSVYYRFWRAYLTDLYDLDTKVLRCRVNFEGLEVGAGLLRRFFWYENSLWVLNKISNYSLTTWDTAECEFVQVQDIAHYTNGQIY